MITLIIQIVAAIAGCLIALMSIPFFLRLRWPAPVLWFVKLYASALSPLLLMVGVLVTIVGLATSSLFVSLVGIYNLLIYGLHIYRVTLPPASSTGFEQAFGLHWENRISPEQTKYFLPNRIALTLPAVPVPRFEQNIPFATIPGTGRKLLCDIWQPAKEVSPSGLAFIYFHGSAFYFLDKDFCTRHFFKHLAAQGHVIMDVAYRLFPETDVMGMVNDVKRAIVWMKENGGKYGVNPNLIVLGGGSAGAHLALLAGYTANDPKFMPMELEGKDVNVCAVISLYGSNDMEELYYHTNQHLTTRGTPNKLKKSVPTKMPGWIIKKMGKEYVRLGMNKEFKNFGTLPPLLGGHPDECPETYRMFTVATHVHPGCPPTLLIHDEDDIMAPVKSTLFLNTRLVKERVPTVMHILPQIDHGFDLILPGISLTAHNTMYDVERFMALMISSKVKDEKHYDLQNVFPEMATTPSNVNY